MMLSHTQCEDAYELLTGVTVTYVFPYIYLYHSIYCNINEALVFVGLLWFVSILW